MPPKVLQLIDHAGFGGAQRIAQAMAISTIKPKTIILRKSQNHITIQNAIYVNTKKKYSLKSIAYVYKYVKKNKVNVIHAHLLKSAIVGTYIKLKRPEIKLFYHEHGQIFQTGLWYSLTLKVVSLFTTRIIAVSNETKKKLIKKGISPKKIIVIPNFIAIPHKTTKICTDKKSLNIGFVGRLNNTKGFDLFASLAKKFPHHKYIAIGSSQNLKELEKKYPHITFTGYIEQVDKFLEKLDIFVNTSRYESFGLSILEAMAHQTPIIASDLPAIKELIKNNENGLLFVAGDSKDLYKQMNRLLNQKELREKIAKNAAKTAKEYTQQQFNSKLLKTYET